MREGRGHSPVCVSFKWHKLLRVENTLIVPINTEICMSRYDGQVLHKLAVARAARALWHRHRHRSVGLTGENPQARWNRGLINHVVPPSVRTFSARFETFTAGSGGGAGSCKYLTIKHR